MAELLFQSKQEKLGDGSLIIITKILGAIDGTTVRQFEDKLIGFFNQGVKNLILIFSDVKYINSTGMGLLVKLADKFQEGGGDIKLVGVPEKVIALFDMLGLLSLFKIYETEEDAIESIGSGGGKPPAPPAHAPAPAAVPPPPVAAPPRPQPPAAVPPPAPRHQPVAPMGAAPQPMAPAAPRPAPPRPAPPPPHPAPAPATEDMGLGGGMTIDPMGGGFEISAESEKQAPVSWPYDAQCGHCNGTIQYAAKGNYQCPRCHSYLTVDEYGQQVVHSAVSSKMIEIKCPCNPNYIATAKSVLTALATQVGYSNVFCEEINGAIEDALGIAIEKCQNPAETFQLLAVADQAEMVLGIKSLNPFLVQGGPRDRRLPVIAKRVDRLEVFPLPNKGQLLKVTKKRK